MTANDVDPALTSAFDRAAAMGDTWRDERGRTYTWADEPGLWLRVGQKRLRVVEPDTAEES